MIERVVETYQLLVPTLRVGTQARTLRVPGSAITAERCNTRSHAERGNEGVGKLPPITAEEKP